MRWVAVTLFLLGGLAFAQESKLQADFRGEKERFQGSCSSFTRQSIGQCGQVLFTDHPLHIAAGSIAPQNGFALGVALATNYTPNESWRLTWNADAVGSFNGSWRAGVYMKAIHTPVQKIGVVTGPQTGGSKPKPGLAVHEYPVFNLYLQSISLNKLLFYGEGPQTTPPDRSFYGMSETIFGGDANVPLSTHLPISLVGHVNGRVPDVRGNHSQSSPSIEQLYSETTATGVIKQPVFVDVGAGLRVHPSLLGDRLQLDYLAILQQFVAPSDSRYSFRRLTLDLGHDIPLYRNSALARPKSINGPDDCAVSLAASKCPAISRNRYGVIEFHFQLIESIAGAGHAVPFYFQPTLGGSDINNIPALPSYPDYRFRAANAMLFRERFEHSLYGPIGITLGADQGTVALTRGDIGFQHFRHSYMAGLTVRAGGLPAIFLMYAWGGGEGSHTIFNINTSLLGGSARPSLF